MGLKNIFSRSKKPPTAMEWVNAVSRRDLKAIKSMLKRGADIEQLDSMGYTALRDAALLHKTELLRLLIENGADLDAKSQWGQTALDLARGRDNIAEVQILEEAAARLKEKKKAEIIEAAHVWQPPVFDEASIRRNTLSAAIESGNCDNVRALFDRDFWTGLKPAPRWEHLKIAVLREDEPMMRLLVTWGARAPEDAAQLQGIEPKKLARYTKILRQYGLPLPPVNSGKEKPAARK